MNRVLACILALLAFAGTTLAGTGVFNNGVTSASLSSDPAPGWATTLHFRVTSSVGSSTDCFEYMGTDPVTCDVGTSLNANFSASGAAITTTVLPLQTHNHAFATWDGVLDYAGTSGVTFSDSATGGASGWVTFSGTPTRIDLYRTVTQWAGYGTGALLASNPQSKWHFEWYWS
jgi:hypothetical protein